MIWLPFLLFGAGAHGVQTILLRELLALSNGSEPAVAFGLAGWLMLAVLGSLVGDRLAQHPRVTPRIQRWTFAALLASPFAALLGLLVARFGKFLAPVEPANPLPLLWLGAVSVLSCGIPALVDGLAFPLLLAFCRSSPDRAGSSHTGGHAYSADALGTAAAGALLSFLLLGLIPGFSLAWSFACLPALGVFALCRGRLPAILSLSAVLLGTAGLWLLDHGTRRWLWQHYHHAPMSLLAVHEAPHGVVEVVDYQGSVSIYRDGLLDLSLPDEQGRDDPAHVAMLQVVAPKSVLLVNSALTPALWHVLDHGPASVQCLDAPPDLIPAVRARVCRRQEDALDSPSVQRAVTDPLAWLRECEHRFDVVFLRVPEPLSLGAARACSVEFLQAAWETVADGGVLVFGPITGGGPRGGGTFLDRNRTIHDTFKHACGQAMVTGDEAPWLIVRRGGAPVDLDFASLWRKAKGRGIKGFSPTASTDEFARERNAFELRHAQPHNPLSLETPEPGNASISTLARPRVAAQTLQTWLQVTKDRAAGLLAADPKTTLWWWGLILVPLPLAFGLGRKRRRLPPLVIAMYAAGFWSALVLWGVLCAFQATHGSLFQYLATINGAHMLGMGLAASAFSRLRSRRLLAFLALCALSAGAVLWLRLPGNRVPFWAAALLGAVSGTLPGGAFAIASGAAPAQRLPGTLYATDLAGGLAGFAVGVCVLLPRGIIHPPVATLLLPLLIVVALGAQLRRAPGT
ncbi:MAG: hypothetical protein HN904_21770 [Victivallales bacterium]|nr:hypothetical protein [Victivallales bacterium]